MSNNLLDAAYLTSISTMVQGFTTTNIHTFAVDSSLSIDKNDLLLKGNNYTQNFIGWQSSLVEYIGVFKVHSINEVFIQNTQVFHEAITHLKFTISDTPWAVLTPNAGTIHNLNIKAYTSLGSSLIDQTASKTFFSKGMLYVKGAAYMLIDGATFDNNFIEEI